MATSAIRGHGTLLQIGDGGSPETFTTIAEVLDIKGPSLSADTIDVTNQSSPGGYREFIAGLLDGGEVTFTINYLPTDSTHNATGGLLADFQNRTKRNFKLVFTDSGSSTWSFSGFVTAFQPSAPIQDQTTADVTIKITGQPTLV